MYESARPSVEAVMLLAVSPGVELKLLLRLLKSETEMDNDLKLALKA